MSKKRISPIEQAINIIDCSRRQKKFVSVMENYEDEVQDIILIFVTPDCEADAYWNELNEPDVLCVLEAVKRGIEARIGGKK